MKRLETADLTVEELTAKTRELKEELFQLRFKLATGQLEDHAQIRTIKRNIARCMGALSRHGAAQAAGA